MGLTLYELFSGCRIPNGKISESSHTAILQKLEAVDFTQDLSAPWAVDLIREMLTWYPGQRPTAQEALQHVPSSTNAVEAERLHPGKRRASELQSHSE
jgi:serine/threonine protein kinase